MTKGFLSPRQDAANVRAGIRYDVAREVNAPKSRLIELHRRLMETHNQTAAKALDSIIGRLEAWQAKHG